MFGFLVCDIATILFMTISNEYDAETMAKIMMAAADADADNGRTVPLMT
jgi:hypothetical protein